MQIVKRLVISQQFMWIVLTAVEFKCHQFFTLLFCAINYLYFVYWQSIDGEIFNTKQLCLTTHDLYYSVAALSCLNKKLFGSDMA